MGGNLRKQNVSAIRNIILLKEICEVLYSNEVNYLILGGINL